MITQPVIELITPELATEYLKTNTLNRRVKKKDVDSYIHQIKTGRFITTHQGIAFDENGALIDGQHRLMAIAASGVPVNMVVTRNVPVSAMSIVDRGCSRSMHDIMCIAYPGDDEDNRIFKSTLAMSAVRQFIMYGFKEVKVSIDEILDVYKEFSDQIKFLYHVAVCKDIGCKRSQIISAAIAAMACGVKEDDIEKFFNVFKKADIEDCAGYNVRAALNWRRQLDEAKYRGVAMTNKAVYLGTQNAIYHFINSEDVSRIVIPSCARYNVYDRIENVLGMGVE